MVDTTRRTFIAILTILIMLISIVGCDNNKRLRQNGDILEPIVDDEYIPKIEGEILFSCNVTSIQEEDALDAYIKAFTEKYNKVTVNRDYYAEDLNTRIFSGDVGDVIWLTEEETYSFAMERKILLPLDSYLSLLEIDIQDVYAGIYKLGLVHERLFMVPREYDHIVMFANVSALKEADLELPENGWSWDEFKSYAVKLTKRNSDGVFTQVPANLMLNYDPIYLSFLEGWGGEWVDLINKEIKLTTDKNVLKGITEMIQAAELGFLYPTGASGELLKKYENLSNQNYVFRQMVFPNLYMTATEYDALSIEWDIVSYPHFPYPSVGAGTSGYGVYNKTKNIDTAAAFALFFLTKEGQTAYHKETQGSVPLLSSLAKDTFWRSSESEIEGKNMDAFVCYPEYDIIGQVQCRVPPIIANLIDGEPWNNMLAQHFAGTKNYIDGLRDIERSVNNAWKDMK